MGDLVVDIPVLPPGINETYSIGKGRMYKTSKAKHWENKAALIVGSTIATTGWEYEGGTYAIEVLVYNSRYDVDAPIKLIIDMLTRKIGIDDNKNFIRKVCIETFDDTTKEGIQIWLTKHQQV